MMPRECPLSAYARGRKQRSARKHNAGKGTQAEPAGRAASPTPDVLTCMSGADRAPSFGLPSATEECGSRFPHFRRAASCRLRLLRRCAGLEAFHPGTVPFPVVGRFRRRRKRFRFRVRSSPPIFPRVLSCFVPLERAALEPVCDSGCRVPVRGFTEPRRQRRS